MYKYLLYPGVIFHELMHYIACIFLGIKVTQFKLGIKESYVKHNNTTPFKISLIALAPFILGNLFALFFIYFAFTNFRYEFLILLILNWLAISIIFYSIPSTQDTKNINTSIDKGVKKLWKRGFFPKLLAVLTYLLVLLPMLVITKIINIFDKFLVLRLILIIVLYAFIIKMI